MEGDSTEKESEYYKNIGLKCGIEIHQQLETHKLFCNCPSIIEEREPDLIIKRRLRAVAGESGAIDSAAEYETERGKEFIYQFYKDANCLVELDEEPPHPINMEALDITLQIALMLKADVLDCVQMMRKTVVDGSNTSGFQRTALIATNGYLEISNKKISIPTICLEEEAAKIVERREDYDVYNLSRLGIPLVEIATAAELNMPKEVKECAEKLGMVLRSTGRVKRGLGTIRQDLNISIRGGKRIEVKGAQDLRLIPKLIENEVMRQEALLKIKEELEKNGIKDIITNKKDLSILLKTTKSKILRNALDSKGIVIGIRLSGLKGLIKKEVQPNRRLGTEFSDYAKSFGVSGILHSDELPAYGITEDEARKISKELGCRENDGFVLIAAQPEKADAAANAVIKRAKLCISGVVAEVRKANADATTSFLRPMPGSARMYPETDISTMQPETAHIMIPKLITERATDYRKIGISEQMAEFVSRSKHRAFFDEMLEKFRNIEPSFIASTIFLMPKDLKSRLKLDVSKINESIIEKVLEELDKGKISKQAISEIMALVAKGEVLEDALKKFERMNDEELKAEIKKIIAKLKSETKEPLKENAVVGRVMEKLRGKADGKLIVDTVKKMLKD